MKAGDSSRWLPLDGGQEDGAQDAVEQDPLP